MDLAEGAGAEVAEKRSGGIQSLVRASEILEEIARSSGGISLAHLSRNLGLHSSTVYHLVKTLTALGYARQDRATKLYRVGPQIVYLASMAQDELEITRAASPLLDDLALQTGEASLLAVRSADEIYVVAKRSGTSAFQMTERMGITRPAHATALGKVLLASMSERDFDLFIKRNGLPALTPRTIRDPARLREEIDAVRRNGIAFDDQEYNSEIRCAAVPVMDFSGQVIAALGISAPAWRVSFEELVEKSRTLKHLATDLSRRFGHAAQARTDPACDGSPAR